MNKNKMGIFQYVLENLETLPFKDKIRVFGSIAQGSKDPGDIDLFVDLRDQAFVDDRQLQPYRRLISIAGSQYGWVDPFLMFENALFVRNDHATGWQRARNATALKKSMLEHSINLEEAVAFVGQSEPSSASMKP